MLETATEPKAARAVLIVGASGMLGRSLMRELGKFPEDFKVYGTAHHRLRDGLRALDVMDRAAVDALFRELAPALVVNCAAERDPERAAQDPQRARALNIDGSTLLASVCAETGSVLVQMSTDYVFDGGIHTKALPPYDVDAPSHPLNFYGETKRDSEKAVLAVPNAHALVLRVPVLYALDCESLSESASLSVACALQSSDPTSADDWGMRFPTLVDDVSVVLRLLISQKLARAGQAEGILHCSSPHSTTKYKLSQLMAEVLGRDGSHVRPDANPPKGEPRPQNTQLDCSKTWLLLGSEHQFTPLADGMKLALERFRGDFA